MSKILLSDALINRLQEEGVSTLHKRNSVRIPNNSVFEPPCSIKWMAIDHSIQLGAFSYAVSGYYFAVRIGRYVSIGENVQIGRHSHPVDFGSTSPVLYMGESAALGTTLLGKSSPELSTIKLPHQRPPTILKYTSIGNDVYIGHSAMIMPGVSIGDGAVIGAMAVVTKDVPPYSVAVGCPARVVRSRFPDNSIDKLLELKWHEFSPTELRSIPLDNIEHFIRGVSTLREQGAPIYKPDLINLSNLAQELGQ